MIYVNIFDNVLYENSKSVDQSIKLDFSDLIKPIVVTKICGLLPLKLKSEFGFFLMNKLSFENLNRYSILLLYL